MRKLFLAMLLISISPVVLSDQQAGVELLRDKYQELRTECSGKVGVDYFNCWSSISPRKCSSLVYDNDRTAWDRCVISCGSAGFFSRTLGQCS